MSAVAIQDRIKELSHQKLDGVGRMFAKSELKHIPTILSADEEVEDMVQGTYKEKQGLLIATNKRLVFMHKGLLSSSIQDFGYSKITSVEYSAGILASSIKVFASGNLEEIKQILPKKRAQEFGENVRGRIGSDSKPSVTVIHQNSTSVGAELEKLASLLEKGILTPEEFQAQKQKLLM